MQFKTEKEIAEFLQPLADDMGVELVDVELKKGSNPQLTVYIETESGVDLNTLEKFHNFIDAPLDDFDPTYSAPYTLNVSSPGLDRPFKTDRDYERNLGVLCEVRLFNPIMGKKYFEGVLVEYDKNTVTIEVEGKPLKIERNKIAKICQAVIFD
ncbi:MAG: ribosome maturation factor RimP [Christensenellaceae bacterium]